MKKGIRLVSAMLLAVLMVSFAGLAQAGDPYAIIYTGDATQAGGSVQSNTVIIEYDGSADADSGTTGGSGAIVDGSSSMDSYHVVIFYDWHGRELSRTSVAHGSGVGQPPSAPHVDGYVFQYWFDEASNQVTPYTFGSPVVQSMNLLPYFRPAGQNTDGYQIQEIVHSVPQGQAMPEVPAIQQVEQVALVDPDTAKLQANHFIGEMVKALEPVKEASAAIAEAERMAQSITQAAPQAETQQVVQTIPIRELTTPEPLTNEQALNLIGELTQVNTDIIEVADGAVPLASPTDFPPTPTPEPLPTPVPAPPETEPPLDITEPVIDYPPSHVPEIQPPASDIPLLDNEPTEVQETPQPTEMLPPDIIDMTPPDQTEAPDAPETPAITEAPPAQDAWTELGLPPPVPEVPQTEEPATEAPPAPSQPDAPLSLDELLGVSQQPTAETPSQQAVMTEQKAVDLVNEILTDMQMPAITEEEKAEEIVELIAGDRTDEAAVIMQEIFETPAAVVTPAITDTPIAQETPAPAIEPYVVATYHYEGELVFGTQVTVTANVYNVPGDLGLSFQWQNDKNGVFEDVPGATGQSHTFTVDEHGLNSSSWRVNVMMGG